MPEDWLTTQEAAELSGYSVQYMQRLLRTGKVAARKFGPTWQISRTGLIAYIQSAETSQDKRRGPKS